MSSRESDMLTVEEIAADLRVSKATVRRWIRQRKLTAFEIERQWRIRKADYDHFLEQRRRGQITD